MKIASLSKDPLGKNLIVSYKYYVSLLENMTLEEKKNTNGYNIKIKDFQIDKLTNPKTKGGKIEEITLAI